MTKSDFERVLTLKSYIDFNVKSNDFLFFLANRLAYALFLILAWVQVQKKMQQGIYDITCCCCYINFEPCRNEKRVK